MRIDSHNAVAVPTELRVVGAVEGLERVVWSGVSSCHVTGEVHVRLATYVGVQQNRGYVPSRA